MKRFGNQSKKIAGWLRELSDLDSSHSSSGASTRNGTIAERVSALRNLIPTSMLHHYDHLKSRGRRSVAPVTRGVCGSCHLAFPSGVLANLRRTSETLNVCINCGAFVYLDEHGDSSQAANASYTPGRKAALTRGSAPRRSIAKSRKVRSTR
jgi:predicted  nucleic acid-binding Zn-ribbon protein